MPAKKTRLASETETTRSRDHGRTPSASTASDSPHPKHECSAVTAAAITKALGGYVSASGWHRAPCPVHGSSGNSLALRDGTSGLVVHCHAGCSKSEILAQLDHLGVAGDADDIQPIPAKNVGRQDRRAMAVNIWQSSWAADTTTQISTYLASRLILIDEIPASIRLQGMWGPYGLHPPSGERRPQMISAVRRVGEKGVIGVSRTFLAIDGSCKATIKPARLFCGDVKGSAVRLGKLQAGQWLVVAEGIETTLAVMQATGLVGWAALSASGIASLILPPEVDKVLIAADNDANGVGLREGSRVIERFRAEGRKAEILAPPIVGRDWNDIEVTASFWGARGHAR
jgi:putative DNA primase/helicase